MNGRALNLTMCVSSNLEFRKDNEIHCGAFAEAPASGAQPKRSELGGIAPCCLKNKTSLKVMDDGAEVA